MNERRGLQEPSDRSIQYCDGCGRTSTFRALRIAAEVGDQFEPVWVCIGDERMPDRRPGCGRVLRNKQ